ARSHAPGRPSRSRAGARLPVGLVLPAARAGHRVNQGRDPEEHAPLAPPRRLAIAVVAVTLLRWPVSLRWSVTVRWPVALRWWLAWRRWYAQGLGGSHWRTRGVRQPVRAQRPAFLSGLSLLSRYRQECSCCCPLRC